MKITTRMIRELNPCQDRLDNFLKHYSKNKGYSVKQFCSFKKITLQDKTWVLIRLVADKDRVSAAIDLAEVVLPLFEKEFPNDKRSRLAIQAARSGDKNAAYYAAADAAAARANAAAKAAAAYAADAAAHAAKAAAAYAAYVADAAAYYAAAACDAAGNAAYAAINADASKKRYENRLLKILTKYLD